MALSVRVLLVLALALAALSPILGVPVVGNFLGRDADFAIVVLDGLIAAWTEGAFWPRWLMDSNDGLGGTVFYSYPPLAHWLAATIAQGTGLGPAPALGLAIGVWRGLAVLTTWAWLRRHVPPRPALAGAGFAALLPYGALIDPWLRFAYSETAGLALLPLLLLALDRRDAAVPGIALAYAALALTNLPLCALAAHLGPAYAWAVGGRAGLLRAMAGGAGGAALAAAFLLPAFGLLRHVNAAGLFNPSWTDNLLGYSPPDARLLLTWACLLGSAALGVSLWRRAGWGGMAPGWRRGLAVLLLGGLGLASVVSLPLWLMLPQLAAVEHPWRAAGFLGPAVAGFAALALVAGLPGRALLVPALAMALLPLAFLGSILLAGARDWPKFLPAAERLAFARAYSGAYSWEHVPEAAAAAGWVALTEGRPDPHPRPVPPPGTERRRDGFRIPAASGDFALPQFHFPAWTARDATGPVPLRASPEGFILVAAGRPVRDLVVRIAATGWEWAGWGVSLLAAAGLAGSAVRHRLRRGLPAPAESPISPG